MSQHQNAEPRKFGALLSKLQSGVDRLKQPGKSANDQRSVDEDVLIAERDDEAGPAASTAQQEQKEPRAHVVDDSLYPDDDDDGLVIDAEPVEKQSKKGPFNTKQKVLLFVVVITAGVFGQKYLSQNNTAPVQADAKPAEAEVLTPPSSESASADTKNGFGEQSSKTDPALSFDVNPSKPSLPIATETESNLPGAGEHLDPFTGSTSEQPSPSDQINAANPFEIAAVATVATSQPAQGQVAVSANTTSTQSTAALPTQGAATATPAPSPFASAEEQLLPAAAANPQQAQPATPGKSNTPDQGEALVPHFGGNESGNGDSEIGEFKDHSGTQRPDQANDTTQQLSQMKTELQQTQLSLQQTQKDLALMKKELDLARAHGVPKAQATTKQVSKSASATASYKPQVVKVPKVVARPRICVTAIAEAARNCTTCVPHAFITENGSETMVGQGDFIHGLRVNIVGDRLDLQNSSGETVHKFWSSNACRPG